MLFLFIYLFIALIVWHYCIEIQLMLYGHFLPYNFIQVLVMSFLMDSLVFSMYVIMSSTNTAYIAISLYNWMLFVHLLPNSSAENFQCMLYRTSKNGHFCLST